MIRLLESLLSRKDKRTVIRSLLTGISRNVGSSGIKVTYQTLKAVVQDATRFLYAHSSTIEATPMQLYISALIFSPKTSLIRRIYRHQIPSWIQSIPTLFESWNPQLRQLYYKDSVEVVAYSPDGKLMASGDSGGKICLWDAITGARHRTWIGHSAKVVSLSFSPSSSLLISTSQYDTIQFWNAITGIKVNEYLGGCRAWSVTFMPDGKRVILTDGLGYIHLWDIKENKEVWSSCSTGDDAPKVCNDMTMAMSPDGRRIAFVDRNNPENVWLLDIENGKFLSNAKCFDKTVTAVGFSPDSMLLAAAFVNDLEIWNVATGATRRIITGGRVNELIFSPDGKTIAIAIPAAIQILNVISGKKWCDLQDFNLRQIGMPQRFAFSPDGSAIASVSRGNGITVWDTRFRTRHVDSKYFSYPSIVAASRDDTQLASASYSDAIRLWDGQTGEKRELYIHRLCPLVDMLSNARWLKNGVRYTDQKKINISSMTFSMDGKFFACVWETKKLQVWDVQSGRMLFARKLDSSTSNNVAFSPDSMLIASSSEKIYFWNTKTGSEVYSFAAPLGIVESIAFSPNGKYLVSSIPTGNRSMDPSVHDSGDFHGYTHISVTVEYDSLFQFSSNSKLLAYRFKDRVVVLNMETLEFVYTFTPHICKPQKLSIFDDNRYLGALDLLGRVFIWDLVTGSVVYKGLIRPNVSSLCFSLNGKHISSLDKIFAYRTLMSVNCHSAGISVTGAWIQADGQDIVYFPHECKDLYDFMAGSALVFKWPPTGFFGEATQHFGCNMLQFAIVDKIMDEA